MDPDTGKCRGYAVLSYNRSGNVSAGDGNDAKSSSTLPISILFGSKKSNYHLRREYKNFLANDDDASSRGVRLQSVVSFWTRNHSHNNLVWELVEPQLQPVDPADIELVMSMRRLIKFLIEADEQSNAFAIIPPGMLLKSRDLTQPVDPADIELVMSMRRLIKSLIEADEQSYALAIIPPDMLLTSRESVGDCCKKNSHIVRALDISPGEAMYVIYTWPLSNSICG